MIHINNILKHLFLCVQISICISANCDNLPMGGRSAGMGHASVALKDFWSVQNNQAGLAGFKQPAFSVYYENRFLLKELSLNSFAFTCPVTNGVLAGLYSRFGCNKLNDNKTGIAYARHFGKYFSAGLQLDYLALRISEEKKSRGVLTFEAGLQSQLSQNLNFGFHVFNPVLHRSSVRKTENIPSLIRAGIAYNFSGTLISTLELEKGLNEKPALRAGMEYHLRKVASLRLGFSTLPLTESFGFGLEVNDLQIDCASSFHPVLGFSCQISVTYQINKHSDHDSIRKSK